MKGVKQLPSEEQTGNKNPSACREVLGRIGKLIILLHRRSLLRTVREAADSTLAKYMAEEDTASTQS